MLVVGFSSIVLYNNSNNPPLFNNRVITSPSKPTLSNSQPTSPYTVLNSKNFYSTQRQNRSIARASRASPIPRFNAAKEPLFYPADSYHGLYDIVHCTCTKSRFYIQII